MVKVPTLIAAAVCVLVAAGASPAAASPRSRDRTLQGYALAYDLQFVECYEVLADAVKADPNDPAPRRAIAAVTWIEILFAQGVATFESFTGEISKGEVERPEAPPALTDRFKRAITEAVSLAERQLAAADTKDAHYQLGATAGLLALYKATVEGSILGALIERRRAVNAMEDVRARDPKNREAALILGMSQYTVSKMSLLVRTAARLGGLSGDRTKGLALLQEAAAPGAETETDARLLLMIVDHREGHPGDAAERLAALERAHPRNRLLWLNQGASAIAANQAKVADEILSKGITHWNDTGPVVLGELAMWLGHRGTARASLQRNAEAVADLERGLASQPRDWIRGRIHGQLGDLALAAGDRAQARRHFAAAIEYSGRGGDRASEDRAEQKLRVTKR
jgi:tetratricopeptide (TPR) repeat protein